MKTQPKIPKVRKVWTTKAGQKIPIYQMTDSHLVNTIKMLERVAKQSRDEALSSAYAVSCMIQGEMASMSIDSDIRWMEEDHDGEDFLHPLYDDLVLDAERRELKLD